MSSGPRRDVEWAVPVAAVLFSVTIALTLGGRLPDPVATSWLSGGDPAGPAPRWIELSFSVLAVALGAAFGGVASRAPTARLARWLVVLGHVASIGMAMRMWRIVAANLDADRWSDSAATISVHGVLLTMTAAGLVGWLASGHRRHDGDARNDGPDED